MKVNVIICVTCLVFCCSAHAKKTNNYKVISHRELILSIPYDSIITEKLVTTSQKEKKSSEGNPLNVDCDMSIPNAISTASNGLSGECDFHYHY